MTSEQRFVLLSVFIGLVVIGIITCFWQKLKEVRMSNQYRIIKRMGNFFCQRKYYNWRGKEGWDTMGHNTYICGDLCFFENDFSSAREAETWLKTELGERGEIKRMQREGTVIVKEIQI